MIFKRTTADGIILATVVLVGLPLTYHFLLHSDAVLGPVVASSPSLGEEVRAELAIKFSLTLWLPVIWLAARIPPIVHRSRESLLYNDQQTVAASSALGIGREIAFVLFGGWLAWLLYTELWFTLFHPNSAMLTWCYFFGDGNGFWAAICVLVLASLVHSSRLLWFYCSLATAFMFEQTIHWIWGCFGKVFVGYHGPPYTLWALFGDIVALAWISTIVRWQTGQKPGGQPPRA